MTSGFLLINKPAGMTSHDVISRLRRITGIRTIGHAGTLDPFATGLLIVAVGRESTKQLQQYVGMDKTYEASIRLGETSTTLDPEGDVTSGPCPTITPEALDAAMQALTGEQQQIPPMHSAIKIAGKKLYELARQGIEIDRPPRAITIHAFTLTAPLTAPLPLPATIQANIACSSGTYVRAIARDLGTALGTAAYLTALHRARIGPFRIEDAAKLDQLSPENWIDWLRADMVA